MWLYIIEYHRCDPIKQARIWTKLGSDASNYWYKAHNFRGHPKPVSKWATHGRAAICFIRKSDSATINHCQTHLESGAWVYLKDLLPTLMPPRHIVVCFPQKATRWLVASIHGASLDPRNQSVEGGKTWENWKLGMNPGFSMKVINLDMRDD